MQLDLLDGDCYAGDPDPTYARLRRWAAQRMRDPLGICEVEPIQAG